MKTEVVVPSPNGAYRQIRSGIIKSDLVLVNEGKNYQCHSVVIAASAQKLQVIFEKDPGIRRIELAIPDSMDVFSQIIDFFYGFDMTITSANVNSAFLLAFRLGVPDILQASSEVLQKLFSFSTVVPSLLFMDQNMGEISLHLDYIREHFNDINAQTDVMELPIPVLVRLLSSDEIDVPNEDTLALWISLIIKRRGVEATPLVDCLHLANVSTNAVLELCALKEVNAPSLLESSKKMRSLPPGSYPERRYHSVADDVARLQREGTLINVPLPSACSVDGIVSQILKNPNAGLAPIKLEASSVHDKYFMPQNLLAISNLHSCWYSNFEPDQWILYDFTPRLLKPTNYTLRTSGGGRGEGHLKSWKVMASNDRREWVQIDERRLNNSLNGIYKIATFSCTCDTFYKYIRISQTDLNHHKDHSFVLSTVEFFGEYIEPKTE